MDDRDPLPAQPWQPVSSEHARRAARPAGDSGECPRCKGKGWTSAEDPRPGNTCDDCNGTGVAAPSDDVTAWLTALEPTEWAGPNVLIRTAAVRGLIEIVREFWDEHDGRTCHDRTAQSFHGDCLCPTRAFVAAALSVPPAPEEPK